MASVEDSTHKPYHNPVQGKDGAQWSLYIQDLNAKLFHQKQRRRYRKERREFLEDHPFCQIGTVKCAGKAAAIYNLREITDDERLLDQDLWMSACVSCVRYLRNHRDFAMEEGFVEDLSNING